MIDMQLEILIFVQMRFDLLIAFDVLKFVRSGLVVNIFKMKFIG